MLSVEHVRAKRDGNRLRLQELPPSKRTRVRELALELSEILVASVGDDRDTVESRLSELELRPSERRIALGLAKLLLDEAEFGAHSPAPPAELRRAVFERAATARRSATLEAPFSRDQVIGEVAPGFGLSPEAFDEALYADLRGAERLIRAPALDPEHWVTRYEQGQVQAVLLRAVKVVVDVQCAVPDAYRSLFQKLKFRKLMYQSERLSGGGYRLTIDGPYSLFEAVTKYGLELSLLLPALEACDVFELRAEVLWGAQRTPLSFEHRHVRRSRPGEASAVRDEIAQLCQDFEALGSRWQARVSEELLELPGSVVCVPDLSFTHPDDPEPVYFELLGFWSRDAVFRRVEWAERGLGHRIVFGVSSKLRVSESVLEPDTHAALYVFKGKPSARALERKLDALRAP